MKLIILLTSILLAVPAYAQNFKMSGSCSREFLTQCANRAEQSRKELAVQWLGHELPNWSSPCLVTIKQTNSHGGGSTSFAFDNDQATQFTGIWEGSSKAILDDVIPHEVLHTVLATHAKRAIPRWADEGAACFVEGAEIQKIYHASLITCLKANRCFPTAELFRATEYPKDWEAFYAQSISIGSFLIQANQQRGFVAFIEDGFANGWPTAVTEHFGYRDAKELQDSWMEWVRAGSPRCPHQVSHYQCSDCFQWQGGQWNRRPQTQQPPAQTTAAIPPPPVATKPLAPIPPKPTTPNVVPKHDPTCQCKAELAAINAKLLLLEQTIGQCKGQAGQQGEVGAAGKQGAQGLAGAPGAPGKNGTVDQKAIDAAVQAALAKISLPVKILGPGPIASAQVLSQYAVPLDGKKELKLQLFPTTPTSGQ